MNGKFYEYLIRYTDRYGARCARICPAKSLEENIKTIIMDGGTIFAVRFEN